jgi:hypothetical protein
MFASLAKFSQNMYTVAKTKNKKVYQPWMEMAHTRAKFRVCTVRIPCIHRIITLCRLVPAIVLAEYGENVATFLLSIYIFKKSYLV